MNVPNKIKEEYAQKQRANKEALEKRWHQVLQEVSEIEDIEHEKRHLAYELGLNAFSAQENDFQNESMRVSGRLEELDSLRTKLLTEAGFDKDYLDMHYSCVHCHDTGYIDGSMCACLKNRILQYNYASSDLDNGESFETFNLNVFRDEKQRHRMSKLYDFARSYADKLPNPETLNFIILGTAGLGKSFTLNCIARRAMQNGLDVIKITSYNMFESILQAIKTGSSIPNYLSCDLLAIDDLGTEPMLKNITTENLFSIINERESQGKATVIASNLSRTDIQNRYDERVGSRLLTPKYNIVVSLYGDDIRLL